MDQGPFLSQDENFSTGDLTNIAPKLSWFDAHCFRLHRATVNPDIASFNCPQHSDQHVQGLPACCDHTGPVVDGRISYGKKVS